MEKYGETWRNGHEKCTFAVRVACTRALLSVVTEYHEVETIGYALDRSVSSYSVHVCRTHNCIFPSQNLVSCKSNEVINTYRYCIGRPRVSASKRDRIVAADRRKEKLILEQTPSAGHA